MPRFDAIAHLVRRIEDLERRNANHQRDGTVCDVDNDKGMVRVTDGVWTSCWLAWSEHNSEGGMKTRSMPKKGAQVTVKTMSGNLEQGTVHPSAYPTANTKMPDAKNGEHVSQMGADDPSKGKQVKFTTDDQGTHSVSATDSHTKTVGDYSHTMTKDGGHVFKAGDNVSYSMTKEKGHELKAGNNFSYTIDPNGGHTISANGQDIKLNNSGVLMNAITAFAKNYGVGGAPGMISQIDNATPGTGI